MAKDGYKKLLVVADSLGRLLGIIGKNYKDYFLMIDEVDVLQTDNNFRPLLENVIDYYLMFPSKNRCMVTATMKEFSNPHLKTVCSKSIFLWVLYCHVIGNLHSVFKCGLLNSFIVAVTIHLFFDGNIR